MLRYAVILRFVAVGVLAAVLFAAYLALSAGRPEVSSDGASQALQAWDMLHGNLLLSGWALTDVSFYTTELPQYALIEALRGLGPGVVHVAAAMTYTLLVLLAGWLAKGRATGAAGAARALVAAGIMLAPQPGQPTLMLLMSPDHVGTGVPVLLAWVIVDRAGSSPRAWARPLGAAATGLLLAWAMVGDQLVAVIGVVPLAAVCGWRCYRSLVIRRAPLGDCRYELWLAGAAVLAVPVAVGATWLITAAGGWREWPVGLTFATAGDVLTHNVAVAGEGLLQLFGADFIGLPPTGRLAVFALVHLVGLGLAGWGGWLALRRFAAADLIVQILAAGILLNLVAYVLSVQAGRIANTREIAALLPFGAVLAGRLTTERLLAARLAPLLTAVLGVYACMLISGTLQPPAPAPQLKLTRFLVANHLTHGLGGYWQANAVTLQSGNKVQVRAVTYRDGRLITDGQWNARPSWYDPATQYADFIVSPAWDSWHHQQLIASMAAVVGRPAHVYVVWPYTIAVWHRNLLARLR